MGQEQNSRSTPGGGRVLAAGSQEGPGERGWPRLFGLLSFTLSKLLTL